MLYLLLLLMSFDQPSSNILFDFQPHSDLSKWVVVNDGVMGGISSGRLYLDNEGHGVFEGQVRLEYNGGFSSIRLPLKQVEITGYKKLRIRLNGDGKRYQVRVKSDRDDYQSYIAYVETSGKWEVVEIDLSAMYPTFRGRELSMPNFPGKALEEIGILFGNKKAEAFRLELDYIRLDK
jgi:hypothetical protein